MRNALALLIGLVLIGAAVPLAGCMSIGDRGLTISPPASSDRVATVEESVADEQAQRQAEDVAIREEFAGATSSHRETVDAALAKLRGDASIEADAIRGELKATAEDLRAGLDPTARLAALRDEALQRAAALAAQAETKARESAAAMAAQSASALAALETRSTAQAKQLEATIERARQGEIDWLEVLGISAGVVTAGGYGLNRYRNRTRKEQDDAPFVGAGGAIASEAELVAAARSLLAAAPPKPAV